MPQTPSVFWTSNHLTQGSCKKVMEFCTSELKNIRNVSTEPSSAPHSSGPPVSHNLISIEKGNVLEHRQERQPQALNPTMRHWLARCFCLLVDQAHSILLHQQLWPTILEEVATASTPEPTTSVTWYMKPLCLGGSTTSHSKRSELGISSNWEGF